MLHLQLLANASPETPPPAGADPISFQTALLVLVAGALLVLAKNLATLNRRLAALENPGQAARPSSAASPHACSGYGAIPPHVIAAISAAVHTTLAGRARILAVGPLCPSRQAWSAEGRREVFRSHRVR